ncbi:hypothetical protein LSAT2_032402 [Lamellibrachia satsuma]|nr:hypothetical protein LSAT2_032402 [Lamellibrachia satsuma]
MSASTCGNYIGLRLCLPENLMALLSDLLRSKSKEENGNTIDIEDLEECLKALGFSPDDEDVEFLKKHLDDNMDGELEIAELLRNIDVVNYHCYYGKELMREFKRRARETHRAAAGTPEMLWLTPDWGKRQHLGGDARDVSSVDMDFVVVAVTYPELLRVLITEGPTPLNTCEARRLLDRLAREFDANFDGKFSYPEFVKIYMSDLLPYKDTLGVESPQDAPTNDAGGKCSPSLRKAKCSSAGKKATLSAGSKPKTSSAQKGRSKSPRKKSDKGSAGSTREACTRT